MTLSPRKNTLGRSAGKAGKSTQAVAAPRAKVLRWLDVFGSAGLSLVVGSVWSEAASLLPATREGACAMNNPGQSKTEPWMVVSVSYCDICDQDRDPLDVPSEPCGHSDEHRRTHGVPVVPAVWMEESA